MKKEKIMGFTLLFLVVLIIGFIISLSVTINKYDNIAKNIDGQINKKEHTIEIKEKNLKKLKEDNKSKEKQLENMNSYIDTLNEKVKEYEK